MKKVRSLNRRGRCAICGRFYSEPTPDDSACSDHVYDYNRMLKRERMWGMTGEGTDPAPKEQA